MSFFDVVREKFDLLFSSVSKFLAPIWKIFLSQGGDVLKDVALKVVKEINTDPSLLGKGGLAKRQAAFDRITTDLKENAPGLALKFGESVINLALEAAVTMVMSEGTKVE